MKLRLFMLVAALTLLFVPLTQAQTQSCNSMINDPAGFVHSPAIITSAARTLINQGAEVHVVIVNSIQRYGSNLADVEREFETNCPSWTTNGERKANLFVVMVAPNDRQKNMFLGSYYAGAFDIPSTYSQLSNTYFKNRQWEMGLAAVLQGTTSQALNFHNQQFQAQQRRQEQQRAYIPPAGQPRTENADSGMSGLLVFFIVLLILGVIAFVCYLIYRATTSTTSTTTTYTSDPLPTDEVYGTQRTYAAAAPSHTTIINNNPSSGDGLLTGIVVGEMLSRPTERTVYVEQPAPTYVEPTTPSYDPPAAPAQAPDSTWEDTSSTQQDTGFSNDTPSYDPPSSDFGGGGDFGGGSSGGDSSF